MTVKSVTRENVLTSETGEALTTNLTKQQEISQAIERINAFCQECLAAHNVVITEPTSPSLRELMDLSQQVDRTLFVLTPARVYLLHLGATDRHTGIIYVETDGV